MFFVLFEQSLYTLFCLRATYFLLILMALHNVNALIILTNVLKSWIVIITFVYVALCLFYCLAFCYFLIIFCNDFTVNLFTENKEIIILFYFILFFFLIINNVWCGTEYPRNSLVLIWTIEYLPETRMSGIFEVKIYKEIPRKIPSTKNYFLNRFVPRNLLLDLFEWAEKPKWKWMAEDISMLKLFKYFNEFVRTKSYFLT